VKERRLHSRNIKREEGFSQAHKHTIKLLWLSDADGMGNIQRDRFQDGHVKQWLMETDRQTYIYQQLMVILVH
jgi:hypothetical protein